MTPKTEGQEVPDADPMVCASDPAAGFHKMRLCHQTSLSRSASTNGNISACMYLVLPPGTLHLQDTLISIGNPDECVFKLGSPKLDWTMEFLLTPRSG